MASRKTYFGIGWPKDAPDPDSGAIARSDPDDRSAPTVVDDEKVAEGLRQLRSWYQSDADASAALASRPAPSEPAEAPEAPGARPTAVGHATAPPASSFQRPAAPDPMRATMYGHDVHKFDLEAELAAAREREKEQQPQQPPQMQSPPPAATTALIAADPARQQEAYRAQAAPGDAIPNAVGPSPTDPFPLAQFGYGEAERLQRPARRSGGYQAPRPSPRVPMASRVMFGIGLTALLAAVVFWWQSNNGSEAPVAAPQTSPSLAVRPTTVIPPTPSVPAPAPQRAAAPGSPSPGRAGLPGTPTPIPAAPTAAPKTELRLSAAPAPPRPPRHRPVVKPVEEPTEVDEATPAVPPVVERETQDVKDVRQVRDGKDVREVRDVRDGRDVKEPKDVKVHAGAKDPAADVKETKARATDRDPAKESKWPAREPREPKSKSRSGDSDAPLPPSLD